MDGAKAGVPKPELVHKLEGCTDEVTLERRNESSFAPGERGGAGARGAGRHLDLQRPQCPRLAPQGQWPVLAFR